MIFTLLIFLCYSSPSQELRRIEGMFSFPYMILFGQSVFADEIFLNYPGGP